MNQQMLKDQWEKDRVENWMMVNSVTLLVASVLAVSLMMLEIVALVSVFSFFYFIYLFRKHWTPSGVFGTANLTTATRLAGCNFLLLQFNTYSDLSVAGIVIILFTLDGLDGFLARRFKQVSFFGKNFDQETDAYFLLILTLIVYQKEFLGGWIISIGLLRYVFVLLVRFLPTKENEAPRSNRGRIVYFIMVTALLTAFTPISGWHRPIILCAALLLLFSFTLDLVHLILWRSPLKSTKVSDSRDVREFFDQIAGIYSEQHGSEKRLMTYRLDLLREVARFDSSDLVVDIGCGPGHHLFSLASCFGQGIGIDISPGMIDRAKSDLNETSWADKLKFKIDQAEDLAGIRENTVDVVISVGAFEHMLDKPAVLKSIYRVLKEGGRFVCLTPNGKFIWYDKIAPFLGINTRHLSSDRFLTTEEWMSLLRAVGFKTTVISHWFFLAKGDLPRLIWFLLKPIEIIGRFLGIGSLQGGLRIYVEK